MSHVEYKHMNLHKPLNYIQNSQIFVINFSRSHKLNFEIFMNNEMLCRVLHCCCIKPKNRTFFSIYIGVIIYYINSMAYHHIMYESTRLWQFALFCLYWFDLTKCFYCENMWKYRCVDSNQY